MIEFKSDSEVYQKELCGLKNNIVRKVDMSDIRFQKLKDMERDCSDPYVDYPIRIMRSDNIEDFFDRRIKDITFFENIVIITWQN
jgi:hypothetical protein